MPSNGGRKYLFHNLGGGHFEEVSAQVGHLARGAGRWRPWRPICAAPAIRICSSPTITASPSCIYNEDGKHFHEVGKETGMGYAPKSGMTRP